LLFLSDILTFALQFSQFNDFGQVSVQEALFLPSQLSQGLIEAVATGLELLR